MDQSRIPDVLRICDKALALQEAERDAYLDAACAGDAEIRREVCAVLARQQDSRGFLETPPWTAPFRPLDVGQRLGPYEVTGVLGAGGMGRVYRARDTRLGRTVALKVIAGGAAIGRPARERFLLEAQAVAALNDPHICALHDVGRDGDVDFLVMECIEGETLAARLARGPLTLPSALEWAAQLADALARAHRQGIVHSDLKPGNIMLTKSGVKLLDFGLACLTRAAVTGTTASMDAAASVANSAAVSVAGTVAGTLPYMAPEQLKGTRTDARTDVFAFGCVLYEMVSGVRAFDGNTSAAVATAVLERDSPPLSSRQPLAPPWLDRLVSRCLAKDPDDRWQSMADVAADLRWLAAPRRDSDPRPSPAGGGITRTHRLLCLGALVAAAPVALGTLLLVGALQSPAPSPVSRFAITAPSLGLALTDRGVAISPDGQTLAFVASDGGVTRVYVRRLAELTAKPLEGTEGASAPLFSPDGRWIGYSPPEGGFMQIPAEGGPPQVIGAGGREQTRFASPSWGPDGIVFGGWMSTGVSLVPAKGGPAQVLVGSGNVTMFLWPELLPGGRAAIFTARRRGKTSIEAATLGSREIKTVVRSGTRARYLQSGHLVYESGGDLMAVAFDPRALETRGEARVVIAGVGKATWPGIVRFAVYGRAYDVSPSGTLVYTPPPAALPRLVWKDRQGRRTPLPLEPRRYTMPTLSPDGHRIADVIHDGLVRNLWVGSVDGRTMMRLTPGDDDCFNLFSRDGKWVFYTSNQDDHYNVYRIPSDGSGPPERLTNSPSAQRATSSAPGDEILLVNDDVIDAAGAHDVNILGVPVRGGKVFPVVKTRFWEQNGVFSPDGRFFAYESNESGRMEVYVQAYPRGGKTKVSHDGGRAPVWNPNGGELFFRGPGAVMAARIVDGVPLGPVRLFPHESDWLDLAVAPDGEHFLVVEGGDASKSPPQINVVVNWFTELKAKVPTGR